MDLTNPIFTDANAARVYLEQQRWPNGPYCPHCGNSDPEQIRPLKGKAHRAGLYQCNACRKQFTVTVGTVFERSKIPLNKWLLATHLMCASKKGVSAHQLHRTLGITYKTAWFMAHRIREALREDFTSSGPLGGEGATVEADETYFGKVETPRVSKQRQGRPYKLKNGINAKNVVFGLVERGGKTRLMKLEDATAASVREAIVKNVSRQPEIHTDEAKLYVEVGKEFSDHQTVRHTGNEYVRHEAERVIHSNTIENVFSVFKRGMKGVYHHCGEAHLHRYLAEFEFRYNRRSALKVTDTERTQDLLRATAGKRLTYRRVGETAHA
jgi:transposase-like protein